MVIRLMAFDPPSRTTPGTLCLSVAGKDLSGYHTLAHEFSHLEQWVRDDALWVKWDVLLVSLLLLLKDEPRRRLLKY